MTKIISDEDKEYHRLIALGVPKEEIGFDDQSWPYIKIGKYNILDKTPFDIKNQKIQIEKLVGQGITDPILHEILTDEFAGKGGTYLYDPATGKRTPVPDNLIDQ